MSLRARQLHKTADDQVADLAERLSTAGEQGLTRPCPGRARLADGSVGAVAAHTTDNYQRIGRFVTALRDGGEQHEPGQHGERCGASDIELDVLLARLAAARASISVNRNVTVPLGSPDMSHGYAPGNPCQGPPSTGRRARPAG
jgi:hypothetical protein